MSTLAYCLVVPPPTLSESAPFHVCERSGCSPDRADYLSRRAKLHLTSLERHHKACEWLTSPEPERAHTHTHTQQQRASLTHIRPSRAAVVRPPLASSNEDTCKRATLRGSTFEQQIKNARVPLSKASPPRSRHRRPTVANESVSFRNFILFRCVRNQKKQKRSRNLAAEEHSG